MKKGAHKNQNELFLKGSVEGKEELLQTTLESTETRGSSRCLALRDEATTIKNLYIDYQDG